MAPSPTGRRSIQSAVALFSIINGEVREEKCPNPAS
jgi:hypothetical protein